MTLQSRWKLSEGVRRPPPLGITVALGFDSYLVATQTCAPESRSKGQKTGSCKVVLALHRFTSTV